MMTRTTCRTVFTHAEACISDSSIGGSRRLQMVLVHGLGCPGLIRVCQPRITDFNRQQC